MSWKLEEKLEEEKRGGGGRRREKRVQFVSSNILQRDAQHLMRWDTADVIITALSNQAAHWLRTQSSLGLAPSFKSGVAQNIALHASLAARNSDFQILEPHPQDALGVGSADPTEPSSVPADGDPHGVREYVTFAVILQSRLYLHTVTLRKQKQRINKTCSCLPVNKATSGSMRTFFVPLTR